MSDQSPDSAISSAPESVFSSSEGAIGSQTIRDLLQQYDPSMTDHSADTVASPMPGDYNLPSVSLSSEVSPANTNDGGGADTALSQLDPLTGATLLNLLSSSNNDKPAGLVRVNDLIEATTDASPTFVNTVVSDAEKLPAGVPALLEKGGFDIVAAYTYASIDPQTASETPRGWPAGSTFLMTDGLTVPSTKEVIVDEEHADSTGVLIPSTRVQGVLDHETGHAVDDVQGGFSHSAAFTAAWNLDLTNLSAADLSTYSYYTQGAGDPLNFAGREETFAETFAESFGLGADSTGLVTQKFPNTTKLVQADIDSIGSTQAT